MSRRVGPVLRKSPLTGRGGGAFALDPESVPIKIKRAERRLKRHSLLDSAPAA
jgi:hypothetical protein